MENNLRKLREVAGMSPGELAPLVGTTAIDIHRIEHNRLLAPVNVAMRISEVLDQPFEAIFPGTREILSLLKKDLAKSGHPSDETSKKLRTVGLEADNREHTLKVLLRGHKDFMFFSIDARDADRLFLAAQDEAPEDSTFIVFDTDELRVAINLASAVLLHFLWDPVIDNVERVPQDKDEYADSDSGKDPLEVVQIFFDGQESPHTLIVDAENGSDVESERNYVNDVFYYLDTGPECRQRVHIVDEDGESALIRAADIALLTAPLWVLHEDELALRDEDGNLPDE